MPLRFFQNRGGTLKEVTSGTGLKNMNGQWRSLAAADIDKDGDIDFVAGNLGLNCKYQATAKEPITLFAKDLDGNGSVDPVVAYYQTNKNGKRKLYPAIGRDQFASQVPGIKKRYLEHAAYAKDDMEKILTEDDKQDMVKLVCEETRTGWIENKGGGKFEFHPFDVMAQLAPVNAIVCTDLNGDGKTDIVIAGNEYQAEVMTGRYDASYGLVLNGDGRGNFVSTGPAKSGLLLEGDVKDMKIISTGTGQKILLAAVNDERLRALRLN
jgi:hypothetical protein